MIEYNFCSIEGWHCYYLNNKNHTKFTNMYQIERILVLFFSGFSYLEEKKVIFQKSFDTRRFFSILRLVFFSAERWG